MSSQSSDTVTCGTGYSDTSGVTAIGYEEPRRDPVTMEQVRDRVPRGMRERKIWNE